MHSYGERIVDVNTMTTLDLNVDLHVVHYGKFRCQIKGQIRMHTRL